MTAPTDKLYLWSDDLETDAVVTAVDPEARTVRLSRTLFHPQGGGQPADGGAIAGRTVVSVRHGADGEVDHELDSVEGLAVGDAAHLQVDAARRLLHARLHSAGHLIADAAPRIRPDLTATSGHHWPGEARVDFAGAPDDVDAFADALRAELDALIAADTPLCVDGRDGGVRTVRIVGAPTPCGGTHVRRVSDIGAITLRRVRRKRDTLRVSYDVSA